MDRKYIDCREAEGSRCSVAISADSERELMEAAVEHGVRAHGYQDNAEFRGQLRRAIRNGHPRS